MKFHKFIDILLDLICSKENIIIQNEGTLFECNYPILVVDILTKENSYINLKDLKNLNEIKMIHIKNQQDNKVFNISPENFLFVKKDKHSLFITYKNNEDEETFEMTY